MKPLLERIYGAEADMPLSLRHRITWRVSEDIAEALGKIRGYGRPPDHFILLGYPATVDRNLSADSLVIFV
jgi:hypothetical protein